MFEIRRLLKLIGSAAASTFAGSWAAIASLAGALHVDVAAGKQAAFAAAGAAVAAVAAWAGGLVKQLVERARGMVAPSFDEVEALIDEAIASAEQAKAALGG